MNSLSCWLFTGRTAARPSGARRGRARLGWLKRRLMLIGGIVTNSCRFASIGGDPGCAVGLRSGREQASFRGGCARAPERAGAGRESADSRARAPAGRTDGARHLRGDRRSGAPQTAARAVQPRPRRSAAGTVSDGGRCPPRTDARELPRRVRAGDPQLLPAQAGRGCAAWSAAKRQVRPGPVRRSSRICGAGRRARPLRRARGRTLEPRLLSRDRPGVLQRDRRPAGRQRAVAPRGDRSARDHREAVRDLARGGARAQPPRVERVRRVAGVPHRPLPGQGDGPEPAGFQIRERHVRAAVEPQLHRPGPDHRGRGHRHRLQERRSTTGRARCGI